MNAVNAGASARALDFKRLFRAASLAVLIASPCAAAFAQRRATSPQPRRPRAQRPRPRRTQPPRTPSPRTQPEPSQPQSPLPQSPQPQPSQPSQSPQSSSLRPAKPAPKAPASVQAAPLAEQSPAQKWFSDVELVDQDGRKHRLYSDLLKGKTVVVNAFFATCMGVCPPMSQNLQGVQEAFKERVGKDLHIISITVDPETDTPAVLKDYATKFGAVPGRYFVTGKKENVDWALFKLGQYVEQKEGHTNIFIVGNETTGLWKKLHGVANIAEIIKGVESVLNDKGATATGGGAK